MLPITRTCARCHIEKAVEAFPIKNKERGTRASYCVPCRTDYGKEHYRQNRSNYLARDVAARVRQRRTNRDVVFDYLLIHPCVDCGENNPVVLDFDHVDPTTKLWTIGKMLSRQASPAIEREIGKCEVRCGNCHRLRTARQFGSYRLKGPDGAHGD